MKPAPFPSGVDLRPAVEAHPWETPVFETHPWDNYAPSFPGESPAARAVREQNEHLRRAAASIARQQLDPLPGLRKALDEARQRVTAAVNDRNNAARRRQQAADTLRATQQAFAESMDAEDRARKAAVVAEEALKRAEEAFRKPLPPIRIDATPAPSWDELTAATQRIYASTPVPGPEAVIWKQMMVAAEGRVGQVVASCSRYSTSEENRAEVLRMLRAAGAVR